MIKLDNFDLLDFIPNSMKNQADIQAICEIFNEELSEFYSKKEQLFIFNLDLQSEAVLNELMYQEHVDYYNTDLTNEQKIKLIKTAFKTHLTKGTRYAVETALHSVLDDFYLREWFEYNGDPGTFILLGKTLPSQEKHNIAEKIVSSYKRASAHVDPLFGLYYESRLELQTKVSNYQSYLESCGTMKTNGVTSIQTIGRRYKCKTEHTISQNFSSELRKASKSYFAKNDKGVKHKYKTEHIVSNNISNELKKASASYFIKNDKGIRHKNELIGAISIYSSGYIKRCGTFSAKEVI